MREVEGFELVTSVHLDTTQATSPKANPKSRTRKQTQAKTIKHNATSPQNFPKKHLLQKNKQITNTPKTPKQKKKSKKSNTKKISKALAKMSSFSPQHVANTAWAYATLGRRSVKLFGALEQRAVKLLKEEAPEAWDGEQFVSCLGFGVCCGLGLVWGLGVCLCLVAFFLVWAREENKTLVCVLFLWCLFWVLL